MKRLTLILALIASFTAAFAQKHITDSLMINGQMRTYTMFLPEGIQKDAPLVVFMHGYSKKKVKNFDRFGLDPVAAREKFAVCYIHGLPDSTNHYGYYVGYPPQASMQKHETSDICKITEAVQERYQLSKVNTFATGMSNGGDMCYLMAYEGQTKHPTPFPSTRFTAPPTKRRVGMATWKTKAVGERICHLKFPSATGWHATVAPTLSPPTPFRAKTQQAPTTSCSTASQAAPTAPKYG